MGRMAVEREPMIESRRTNDPGQIGQFRVIGRLGTGGFGKVYVAVGRANELVAVKVMQAERADNPHFQDRFAKETDLIGRVASRYVPRLKDHGTDGETMWLATELVRGPSLGQVVRLSGAPLPERTVWCLALGLATALHDIHNGAGLAHRDLKPGNVLLMPDGPRVIDFGLAHLAQAEHQTMSGEALFSAGYAPPEQRWSLWKADKPADVFALGGTLLFAVTGHPPYGNGREPSTALPNLADLPGSLYDVIAQCLCGAEEARPSVDDLIGYFRPRADAFAGGDGYAFTSVLTAGITDVINAWQRELDDVIRMADPAPAGPWGGSGGAARPEPVRGPAVRLTGARVLTESSAGHRDGGRVTPLEPARVRSLSANGQHASLRWKSELGDWLRAPVAVRHGRVAAASLAGVVACFAAGSGRLLGPFARLGTPVRSAVLPPGTTSTGWAYAGGADGVLYAIDVASGNPWPLLYASGPIEGPPVTVDDRVYVLSADGCVWEIDARATAEPALLCHLGGPALGTLTVADGTIIATSAEGCVYAIDPAERTVRWRRPTSGLVFGAPAVAAGWLYIAGTDGQLWSVRINDGEQAALDIGAPVHATVVHDRGRLYVGGADGRVRSFSVAGGSAAEPRRLWMSPEIGEISGLAARDGTVVIATGHALTALDGAGGSRRELASARTLITAAPVIAENLIYVAGLDGTVSCLSLTAWSGTDTSNSLLKGQFMLGRNCRIPGLSAYT